MHLSRFPLLIVVMLGVSFGFGDARANEPDVKGLSTSADYSLEVDGRQVPVHETVKTTNHGTNNVNRMSFAGFDTESVGRVELTIKRPFHKVELRPRRAGIEVERDGDQLSFAVKPLQQITLVFDNNYDNSLVIAANPADAMPLKEDVQHYFDAGVHRLQSRLKLALGDRVYLAEGAIVCGAFDMRDVEDVRIFGRGIVYGGETLHQEDYRVFAGNNTNDITIEGVTACNAILHPT